MKEKKSKVLGTLLFLVLIAGLFYLILFSQKRTNNKEVKMIEVTGNKLLSAGDYLKYTRLDDLSAGNRLTLSSIKWRFEKHPYVERADVEYVGGNVVKVILTEKKMEAVLLLNGETKFITDKFEIVPIFADAKIINLPVISNFTGQQVNSKSVLKNDDMIQAFKIIDAAKLTNVNLYKRLSEINLRHGGQVVLSFSGIKPPVIFGRGEAAKKLVYLDVMWKELTDGSNLVDNSEYIDVRFANEIFIGSADSGKTGLSNAGLVE